MWYAKVNAGVAKVEKTNGFKSKADGIATVAFGYYFMDNLRAELAVDHLFGAKMTSADATNNYKNKVDANTVMVNMYADLADMGGFKFALGAGAGVARVGGKETTTLIAAPNTVTTVNVKDKNAFTYALHAVVSSEFDHGMHAELAYSFKDYNKKNNFSAFTKRIVSHNVTAGVRFDI